MISYFKLIGRLLIIFGIMSAVATLYAQLFVFEEVTAEYLPWQLKVGVLSAAFGIVFGMYVKDTLPRYWEEAIEKTRKQREV